MTTDFKFCGRVGAVTILDFWNWFRSGVGMTWLSLLLTRPERNQFQKTKIFTAPTRPQNLKSVVTNIQIFIYYSTLVQTNISILQTIRDQYIYIHMHAYVCTYTRIYIHLYAYVYLWEYFGISTWFSRWARNESRVSTPWQTDRIYTRTMYVCMIMNACIYTHICFMNMYMYIHKYIHMYRHTYMYE